MSVTQGYATKFQYGNMPTASGSNSWTDFANIIDIKPGKIKAKDIDTSTMQTANQFETTTPGWASAGEAECKIQFDRAQNAAVYALFRVNKGFRIVFNDAVTTNGSNWAFDGYVNGFANEVDRENLVTADITVKIVGQPVFTQAS